MRERSQIKVASNSIFVFTICALVALFGVGCGTTQSQLATQQLLLSDAVDRAVATIDFKPLAGKKVYLDDQYAQNLKTQGGVMFVNADYILSSLRQQLFAAKAQIQEKVDTADYVVEVRIGALGTDGHEVTYGLPPNNTLNSAVSVVPNAPNLPSIPEIAFAKRNDQLGAAKVAVYAYDRKTRLPLWQSGSSVAVSDAKNVWVLGIGPFQRGTIYQGTQFAGEQLDNPLTKGKPQQEDSPEVVAYQAAQSFNAPGTETSGLQMPSSTLKLSSFIEPLATPPDPSAQAATADDGSLLNSNAAQN